MTQNDDQRYMALALMLGRRGLGRVAPWPSVGCVIVRDGIIVGRGRSDRETMRHAERVALDQAGDLARGATAYVTLEPCSHHGNTPPCADALITAGIARVVCATTDPNPLVAGQGLDRLRDAGIEVLTGVEETAARRDNAGFLKVQEHGLPFVTLKLASSFDGKIATATGESKWITGPEARRQVHAQRATHDAVLIGAGTARADDPTLTVRGLGILQQPIRVVATRHLDIPQGKLFDSLDHAPLWLCHGLDPDADRVRDIQNLGAETVACEVQSGQLDLRDMLSKLATLGLTRIFCEGGGSLAASLLTSDLADRLVGFTAGVAIGAEGTPSLGVMGLGALADAPRFDLVETQRIGNDVMHVWERR